MASKPIVRGWIDGRENHRVKQGEAAGDADKADRAAWPGLARRSAYTHLLNLPDHVVAADRLHARAIFDRIEMTIEKGGWTTTEFNRLHQMRKAWARRQSGKDLVFNLQGWNHKGGGKDLTPTLKALKKIREVLECGQVASNK